MIRFPNVSRSMVAPPERRRVIVIGAGAAGMSAAFHLGEHSLLLDCRAQLDEAPASSFDDDFAASGVEHKPVFISCASTAEKSREQGVIHVTRWSPPVLTSRTQLRSPSVRTLAPLLTGELRLNARVVRIDPLHRRLQLADGARFTFDKLLCAMSLRSLTPLVIHEMPGRVRHEAALRYWLQDQDVEVADPASLATEGDVDAFAAGKRYADRIAYALAERFGGRGRPPPSMRLFTPRLV